MTAHQVLRDVGRLILPATCAGCGVWDTTLCRDCRALLDAGLFEVSAASGAGNLPVHAATHYIGPVRTLITSWKRGQREDLDTVLADVSERAGRQWVDLLSPSARARIESAGLLAVVPAPSGLGRRLGGRLVAAQISDAVATGIAHAWLDPGVVILSVDVLRRQGGMLTHQAGRSSRARRQARAAPPRVLASLNDLPVLVVDDVVTTGATLGSCRRALEQAGATVVGALTLAAPPPVADPLGPSLTCARTAGGT